MCLVINCIGETLANCILGEIWWICENMEIYMWVIILSRLVIIIVVEFFNHLKINYVVCLHLIMFNYEMWTNPHWSFGCPPTLFVWMGRRRAWIICFSLVSRWMLALELPRFAFGVLESGTDLGVFVYSIFIYDLWRFLFVQYVELRFYIWWCSMIMWHDYFGDVFFTFWWYVIIIPLQCFEKNYLCMLNS